MTQTNPSQLNLVQICHKYYEEYAKNTILSFFKDITQFSQVFNATLELNINFYSKVPIFKWSLNQEEVKSPLFNYNLEELNIIFDYISNFTDVDNYQRILNMTVSPEMLKNLKLYADESLANNDIDVDYKALAKEPRKLFLLFSVAEFIENLTHLAKTLELEPLNIEWYNVNSGKDYLFGNPQDEHEEEIYDEATFKILEQFLLNYDLEILKSVDDHILVNDYSMDYRGDLVPKIKQLAITQNFNQNLEALLDIERLNKLKSLMEKEQLEQSVKITESKTVKQKL
jgi:hypothetical protein